MEMELVNGDSTEEEEDTSVCSPVPTSLLQVQFIQQENVIYKVLVPHSTPPTTSPINPIICQVHTPKEFQDYYKKHIWHNEPILTTFMNLSSKFRTVKSIVRLPEKIQDTETGKIVGQKILNDFAIDEKKVSIPNYKFPPDSELKASKSNSTIQSKTPGSGKIYRTLKTVSQATEAAVVPIVPKAVPIVPQAVPIVPPQAVPIMPPQAVPIVPIKVAPLIKATVTPKPGVEHVSQLGKPNILRSYIKTASKPTPTMPLSTTTSLTKIVTIPQSVISNTVPMSVRTVQMGSTTKTVSFIKLPFTIKDGQMIRPGSTQTSTTPQILYLQGNGKTNMRLPMVPVQNQVILPVPNQVRLPVPNQVRFPVPNQVRLPVTNQVRLPVLNSVRAPFVAIRPKEPQPRADITKTYQMKNQVDPPDSAKNCSTITSPGEVILKAYGRTNVPVTESKSPESNEPKHFMIESNGRRYLVVPKCADNQGSVETSKPEPSQGGRTLKPVGNNVVEISTDTLEVKDNSNVSIHLSADDDVAISEDQEKDDVIESEDETYVDMEPEVSFSEGVEPITFKRRKSDSDSSFYVSSDTTDNSDDEDYVAPRGRKFANKKPKLNNEPPKVKVLEVQKNASNQSIEQGTLRLQTNRPTILGPAKKNITPIVKPVSLNRSLLMAQNNQAPDYFTSPTLDYFDQDQPMIINVTSINQAEFENAGQPLTRIDLPKEAICKPDDINLLPEIRIL